MSDAWRLWRRDWEVLTAVAGLFIFLPMLAMAMFIPDMPPPPAVADAAPNAAAMAVYQQDLTQWMLDYGGWQIAAQAVVLFGQFAIVALYLAGDQPPAGRSAGDVLGEENDAGQASLLDRLAKRWRNRRARETGNDPLPRQVLRRERLRHAGPRRPGAVPKRGAKRERRRPKPHQRRQSNSPPPRHSRSHRPDPMGVVELCPAIRDKAQPHPWAGVRGAS